MGVFEKFVNRTKSASQVVGQKANEIVEITKLNLAISEKNDEISKIYEEIGKMVFEAYKDNDPSKDVLNEKCETIDSLQGEIKTMQEKINSLKKIKDCPKCGEENISQNIYCTKCGAKLTEAEKEEIVVDDYVVADEQPVQGMEEAQQED